MIPGGFSMRLTWLNGLFTRSKNSCSKGLRFSNFSRYNFASVGALAQLVEQRTLNP